MRLDPDFLAIYPVPALQRWVPLLVALAVCSGVAVICLAELSSSMDVTEQWQGAESEDGDQANEDALGSEPAEVATVACPRAHASAGADEVRVRSHRPSVETPPPRG